MVTKLTCGPPPWKVTARQEKAVKAERPKPGSVYFLSTAMELEQDPAMVTAHVFPSAFPLERTFQIFMKIQTRLTTLVGNGMDERQMMYSRTPSVPNRIYVDIFLVIGEKLSCRPPGVRVEKSRKGLPPEVSTASHWRS